MAAIAEFARLIPRTVVDSELAIIVRDSTSHLYGAVAEVITNATSVLSVAGRTGHVELTPVDVGLDQVANLAPADLPISTAVQQALDGTLTRDQVIPQDRVEDLIPDLAARVRLVNGNPPDEYGNVVLSFGLENLIPKPETDPQDRDLLTWLNDTGWTPLSLEQHVALNPAVDARLLPDPDTCTAGDIATVVDGKWVASQPPVQPAPSIVLTSPDGSAWTLSVDDSGSLSAVKAP